MVVVVVVVVVVVLGRGKENRNKKGNKKEQRMMRKKRRAKTWGRPSTQKKNEVTQRGGKEAESNATKVTKRGEKANVLPWKQVQTIFILSMRPTYQLKAIQSSVKRLRYFQVAINFRYLKSRKK